MLNTIIIVPINIINYIKLMGYALDIKNEVKWKILKKDNFWPENEHEWSFTLCYAVVAKTSISNGIQ